LAQHAVNDPLFFSVNKISACSDLMVFDGYQEGDIWLTTVLLEFSHISFRTLGDDQKTNNNHHFMAIKQVNML